MGNILQVQGLIVKNPLIMEDRLINFAILVITLGRTIVRNFEGVHLYRQLVRSGTAVALNFGEARNAESKRDFVHKMNIILKELRETQINLKIIGQCSLSNDQEKLHETVCECNELTAIFVASLKTAKANLKSESKD
jgi:four helix bundle protein